MGAKNITGVRKVIRGGKPHLVIDFRYTDPNGVRQRFRRDASVQLQAAAYAEAKRLMARAADTGSPDRIDESAEAKHVPTLREFYETTFATHFRAEFRPSTNDRYSALWRQSVGPFFGDKPVTTITEMDLRAFATTLKARGVQLKGPMNFARTLLRAAFDAKLLDEVPKMPRKLIVTPKKLPDTYSDEDVQTLRRGTTGWLGTAIALATLAGLRQGEVRAIEVRDVDLVAGRLYVRRSFSLTTVLLPKSGAERVVPLSPELADVLRPLVLGKPATSRLVVTSRGGTPTRQEVLKHLVWAERRLGVTERSFHALRHYFCSSLVRRGASIEAIRELAGHSDLAVTQRYVHATAADLESAVAKLTSPTQLSVVH